MCQLHDPLMLQDLCNVETLTSARMYVQGCSLQPCGEGKIGKEMKFYSLYSYYESYLEQNRYIWAHMYIDMALSEKTKLQNDEK